MAIALSMYAEENDDRLPSAERWMDLTKKDIWGGRDIFRCSELRREKGFGYAMNSSLSGVSIASVSDPSSTPLVYDSSNLSWNAHDPFKSTPNPKRHRKGNMVGYLDGQVIPREPAL